VQHLDKLDDARVRRKAPQRLNLPQVVHLVSGMGFRVEGFRVSGLWFRVSHSRSRVQVCEGTCASLSNKVSCSVFRVSDARFRALQGYLAYTKPHHPRTVGLARPRAPTIVPGEVRFLMSEVALYITYERGSPVYDLLLALELRLHALDGRHLAVLHALRLQHLIWSRFRVSDFGFRVPGFKVRGRACLE